MSIQGLNETLDLIGEVLKFDIVQFWKFNYNEDNEIIESICQYSYLSSFGKELCPEKLNLQKHSVWIENIKKLIDTCNQNLGGYHWMSSNKNDIELIILNDELTGEFILPIKTTLIQLARVLGSGSGYLVCHSFTQLSFSSEKIDYVSTICDAAFLASSTYQSCQFINEDLDSKDFFFVDPSIDEEEIPQPPLRKLSLTSKEVMDYIIRADSIRVTLEEEENIPTTIQFSKDLQKKKPYINPIYNNNFNNNNNNNNNNRSTLAYNSSWSYNYRTSLTPLPSKSLSTNLNESQVYPILELPILQNVPDNIPFESLTELKHLGFGEHCSLHNVMYNGTKVLLKLMIPELVSSTLAQREFDHEEAILRRIDHPNIVKILGSGKVLNPSGGKPRKFLLLEWLEGGLVNMISTSKGKDKLIRKLIPTHKSIPLNSVLRIATDLANALNYLHNEVYPDVTIIHGQIEPENIRFDRDGNVKLIGFRSSTCMRKRLTLKGYPVLENRGTLRYTPPEVALRLSYSEKSDIYQFGIVLWQIARDKVPFLGLTRTEYLDRVVYGGERPKVDKTWSPQFISLLHDCCANDQFKRPSCDIIEHELTEILDSLSSNKYSPSRQSRRLSWLTNSENIEERNSMNGFERINKNNNNNDYGNDNDNNNNNSKSNNNNNKRIPNSPRQSSAKGSSGNGRKPIGESDRKSAWF